MSKKTIKNFGGKFNIVEPSLAWDVKVDEKNKTVNYLCKQVLDDKSFKSVFIKKIIYNDPATIVFWSDDTKTFSKCRYPDVYNPETGLLVCCMKKLVGTSEVMKLLKDWIPYKNLADTNNQTEISAADVRRKYKSL